MSSCSRVRTFAVLGVVCLLSPCRPVAARADDVIDSPMYHDPDLPTPRVESIFPEKAKGLWLRALDRPEADWKCKAADAIALAHRRGVKDMETTADALVAVFAKEGQDPAVRLAVARALVELDAKGAAEKLFKQSQAVGGDLREIVEPALARWDYTPARAAWLERLRDPATPQRSLVLAMQGLATVREGKAADRLLELVRSDRTPGPIRLEAARALGTIQEDDLEKVAEGLAEDESPRGIVGRLAAVALLHRQKKNDETVHLLQRLARDAESSVAAPAAARLLEIDPDAAVAVIEQLLSSPDANVRSLGVDVLFRRPTERHVHLLADMLFDEHPDVRTKARGLLERLAGDKDLRLHDVVVAETTRVLEARKLPSRVVGLAAGGFGVEANRRMTAGLWRGLEQAVVLLTRLDHKPAAGRLVELLTFDRPEVQAAAAWGLRRLDVEETLPDVLKFVEARLKKPVPPRGTAPDPPGSPADYIDHQLSQLNQFLGRRTYAPAEETLRLFIPRRGRDLPAPEARAAAIWALGRLHEGKPDDDLAAKLEERLNDVRSIPPEDDRVRWACGITLGRMKAEKSRASLDNNCREKELSSNPVNNACLWALAQLDGKDLPPPRTTRAVQRDWFLVPND